MRKFYIVAILTLGLASACQKAETPAKDEVEDCVVTFSIGGEISTSETPLTRAGSPNDLYAVQVFKGNDAFAFGLFDNIQDMRVNMKQGSSYKVQMCLVSEAKIHLSQYYSLTNNGLQVAYSATGPYYNLATRYRSTYYYYDRYLAPNTFYYNSNNSIKYYSSSSSTTMESMGAAGSFDSIHNGSLLDIQYPTCTDWFYGEINNYSPTGSFENLEMTLKRTGFQLQYVLEGVTDGEVTVTIANNTRTFFNNTTNTASYTSTVQFIAFYDTYSAWQYADNYTENLNVSVTWKRGIGVTQDLGTKTVQIKRNCLNKIKITLGSDDRGAGVNLSTEAESSMGNVTNDIPVQ